MCPKPTRWILFLILIYSSCECFAQRNDHLLRRAERNYKKGKHEQALRLLDKADGKRADECGLSAIHYYCTLNTLRSRVYIGLGDYLKARAVLDSYAYLGRSHLTDSLRILTLQMQFGKDSLRRMVDSSLNSAYVDCFQDDCNLYIPLINKAAVIFIPLAPDRNTSLLSPEEYVIVMKDWKKYFYSSYMYKLLNEKQ